MTELDEAFKQRNSEWAETNSRLKLRQINLNFEIQSGASSTRESNLRFLPHIQ